MKSNHLLHKSLVVSVSVMLALQSQILIAETGQGNQQTDAPITFQGGASAEQSAGDSGAQGALTAGIGAASGVMQIAMGQPMTSSSEPSTVVMGWALISMGGMQLAQAALTMGNSKKARNSQGLAANFGSLGDGSAAAVDFGSQESAIDSQIAAGFNELQKAGATVDPNTGVVTTPNGKISPSAFSSPAALAAATGMSLSDAERVLEKGKAVSAKVASKYKVSGVGFETAGGGGGAAGSALKFNYDSSMPDFSKLFGQQKRDPAAVAGMSKLVGGEPVGVAGDDIFKMMNRRYQTLNDRQRFMDK